MKYVYAVLALAFVGFAGLTYILAKDVTLSAYTEAFITALAANIWWHAKWG